MVCNRPVADYDMTGEQHRKQVSVHMTVDGKLFPANLDLYDHPESIGAFTVGSECAKKIPATFRSMG